MTNKFDTRNDSLLIVRTFLTQTLGYPSDDYIVQCVDGALEKRDKATKELSLCRQFIQKYAAILTADEFRARLMAIDTING